MKNNKSAFDNITFLNRDEMKTTNGGILPVIVGIIILSLSFGYSDGRRDKHAVEKSE